MRALSAIADDDPITLTMSGGRKINLGAWDTEAEAHAAYMGAAAILHGDFWFGNRQKQAADAVTKRRA